MRSVPRENRPVGRRCKRFDAEAFEDHLGVAFIQPGSSRYEQRKAAVFERTKLQQGWNRVLKKDTSLAILNCRGRFYVSQKLRGAIENNNGNNIGNDSRILSVGKKTRRERSIMQGGKK